MRIAAPYRAPAGPIEHRVDWLKNQQDLWSIECMKRWNFSLSSLGDALRTWFGAAFPRWKIHLHVDRKMRWMAVRGRGKTHEFEYIVDLKFLQSCNPYSFNFEMNNIIAKAETLALSLPAE